MSRDNLKNNSMNYFSFRATHYLQYTDAASFTWRKGPDQVFHKKYASSRPYCKYTSAMLKISTIPNMLEGILKAEDSKCSSKHDKIDLRLTTFDVQFMPI